MATRRTHHKLRPTLSGVATYFGWLVAYCALQTLANTIAVQLQDWIVLTLPVVAAVSVASAFRAARVASIAVGLSLGGIAAFVFAHLYFLYFRWVIIETLHIWHRDEGLYFYLASWLGLLAWVAAALGFIAGGWAAARDAQRTPQYEDIG